MEDFNGLQYKKMCSIIVVEKGIILLQYSLDIFKNVNPSFDTMDIS